VVTHVWTGDSGPQHLAQLLDRAAGPGRMLVRFDATPPGPPVPWRMLEAWTRTRAVTVADVAGAIASPALEVALCCDVVFIRSDAELRLPSGDEVPSPAVVWALGRAGRAALARGLLGGGVIGPQQAVRLGLATAVLGELDPLPWTVDGSIPAVTAARDLMRAGAAGDGARALELATFRWLFAVGDPEEGARAFLEKRNARFSGEARREEE
jgi:enoyl-CoA hydratase/carnithine racemase